MADVDIDNMDENALRAALKLMREQSLTQKEAKAPVITPKIVVQTEKKLRKKFDGTGSYLEWKCLAEAAIEQRKEEEDKVSLLLGSLEGKALREVQRHAKTDRDTAAKVMEILHKKYGDRRTATQIKRQFYSLVQGDQSVNEFCDALVECLQGTEDRLTSKADQTDLLMRDQFAENVADPMLRWELRKARDEDTDNTSFDDLRDIALEWESGMAKKKGAYSAVQEVQQPDPQLKALQDLVAQQQSQINTLAEQTSDLLKAMKSGPEPGSRGPGLTCFYCGKRGHKKQYCRKRLHDAAIGTTQDQDGQPSKN